MFNHIIAKAVGEYLPGQRRYGNTRRLSLKNVAEVLEVRVSPAHAAMSQLERGDIGSAEDLIVGIHIAAHAMRARVLDLIDCQML